MSFKKKQLLRIETALLGLSAIGLGLAFYLTRHFFNLRDPARSLGKSICNFSSRWNCDAVSFHAFAEVVPGLPLSLLVFAFFCLCLGLTASGWVLAGRSKKKSSAKVTSNLLRTAYLLFNGVGLLFGLKGLWVFWQLDRYCAFCLGIDVVLLLQMGLAWFWFPFQGLSVRRGLVGVSVALVLGGAVVVGVIPQLRARSLYSSQQAQTDREWFFREHVHKDLSYPEVPYLKGSASSPIQLVMVGDFGCPLCKEAFRRLILVLEARADIGFRWVHFPADAECNRLVSSTVHPYACKAAQLWECALQSGLTDAWTVAKLLLRKEGEFPPEFFHQVAEHLKKPEWISCVQAEGSKERIRSQVEWSIAQSVEGTPTYYLNGYRFEGVLETADWVKRLGWVLNSIRN